VNLWLGQDGYDYPLSADYARAWDHLVQGVRVCADSNPQIRLAIEYKLKEPRTHCYVSTVGKALLLVGECARENVGGLVDTGHALLAYENPAESAALLHHYGAKLFYIHLNDNWRSWDDDMLVASVHIPEFVEFFFWLDRLDYRGWIGFDMYPYRENTRQIVRAGIDWTLALARTARIMDRDALARALAEGNALAANDLLRRAMFPVS
jgi:xylose isomerase